MRKVLVVVAAVVVAVVSVGGCGVSQEEKDVQVRAEIMARPSLESAVADLNAMMAEIRQRWDDELGLGGWSFDDDAGGSGCGNDVWDAGELDTGLWVRKASIPDDKWMRARAIVAEVGARYGFEPPFAVVSKPGIHDAYAHGPFGAELSFGSGVNTTISARTGCHLPAAAKAGAGG